MKTPQHEQSERHHNDKGEGIRASMGDVMRGIDEEISALILEQIGSTNKRSTEITHQIIGLNKAKKVVEIHVRESTNVLYPIQGTSPYYPFGDK